MPKFQPGQSGNPGGRPKEVGHVKELAREHTAAAIRIFAAIMRGDEEPTAARFRARTAGSKIRISEIEALAAATQWPALNPVSGRHGSS